jgi:hypothetical protein
VDKRLSETDLWSMKYPATPPDLLPDAPAVVQVVAGCLIAVGVVFVVMVVLAVVGIEFVLHAGDAEARKSQHNAVVLFSALTGQVPNSSNGAGGSNGPEARAIGPLQGHPTPREEMAKAIAAFTATGYTPMIDTTPGKLWCSLDTYPPSAYPPGAAPPTVRVTCNWNAQRLPHSSASVAIEVAVPTVDLRPTLDNRGYFEPNVGLVVDLPLNNAVVVVSAST